MAPYMLESNVDFPTFCELAKLNYALAASKTARFRNGRPNYALISAQTGINRRELRQILKPNLGDTPRPTKKTLADRIRKIWRESPRFSSKKNTPRKLKIADETNGFFALARLAASDLPPSAILSYAVQRNIAHCSRGYAEFVNTHEPSHKKRLHDPIQELLYQTRALFSQSHSPENLLRINGRAALLRTANQSEAKFLLREADESVRRTLDGIALPRNQSASGTRKSKRYTVNIVFVTTLAKTRE